MSVVPDTTLPNTTFPGAAFHGTSAPGAARLGADASQRTFRLLLDAFSRPGRIVDLSALAAHHGVEPVLLPVLALADLDTTVAVIDEPDRGVAFAEIVARSTNAPITRGLDDADLVLASGTVTAAQIALLRCGDAWAPECGARLALRCTRLDDTDRVPVGGIRLRVSGPGASSGRTVAVDGVAADVFDALQLANAEHPAGVDTWLIDGGGRCVGVPRSSSIEIMEETD
ncbi:MAG: phosphonate C-P lyase system protein PhnH [Ilumatobacter sp.]